MNLSSPRRFLPAKVTFLALIVALALANIGRAEIPPLLQEAFANSKDAGDHWAYTETSTAHVKFSKEEKAQITIIRFDPSKPYAEQYTPVQVNSHPPTERDLKKYRQQGEKRGEDRAKTAAKPPAAKLPLAHDEEIARKIDIDHIAVTEENDTSVTYAVPPRKGAKMNGVALDKFELLIRINKERRTVENVSIRLLESMRVKLIANVRSGAFSIDFSQVDPKYPAVETKIQGSLDMTLFFFKKLTAGVDQTRTEYKRVKPYNDRFDVEIGPLKMLDL